ncbi:MAG: hypothetical protein MUO73_01975 [Thermoplasmata archaeon]|nr:hypothetical protein [Thermoplasmata archaeon]
MIKVKKYSYWDQLNRRLIYGMVFFGTMEFVGFLHGAILGLPFAMIFYGIAVWAFYDALPPKWVRDKMRLTI